jgi:hypothetical protein
MSLKEELKQYYLEQEADYDPEETANVLEILSEYNDDLDGINATDKTLLLRLIDDDKLYEKVNSINKSDDFSNKDPFE